MSHLFAIVDIETTGGQVSNGCITEIAISIFDGEKVIEKFESLIKPFYFIPRYITELTGISNEMVENSPTFEEVADTIYELLNDKIFVAHNVNFDYSFIKQHLKHAGIEWDAPKLCTVRLSRKIFPGLPSYSLGNLTASLNINLNNRHRAAGDCDATVILFDLLLQNDTNEVIFKQFKKRNGEQNLPSNLSKTIIDNLPQTPGIYYFHDAKGKVIYIGKAINIYKRVKSHFTGNKITKQRQDFLLNISDITFETTPTELLALILEANAIKKYWPKYNKALKSPTPKFGLFEYYDQNNFHRLFIGKYNKSTLPLLNFYDLISARNHLHHLVSNFDLCPELCKIGDCETCQNNATSHHQHNTSYNEKVAIALSNNIQKEPAFFIIDKGRNEEEISVIWCKPNEAYAMGYIDKNNAITDESSIIALLKPFEGSLYLTQLLQKYTKVHPQKVRFCIA